MFTIERMQPRDVVDVMRLAARMLPEQYPPEFFLGLIDVADRHTRVAREVATGRVVGFIVAAREPAMRANVLLFAVDPAHQGEGIGRTLLHDVERSLALSDVRQLRLEVRTDNARAIRFYQREGFSVEGLEEGVYKDGGDALAMVKPLL